MQLEHSFTVPVTAGDAWEALTDFERVAPCLPGATLRGVDGDVLDGAVKVKLGPVMLNYEGTATILEKDPTLRRMVMDGRAKDSKGNGTAAATISTHLEAESETSTRVQVCTDLNITGRPAQFGRGMMQDVGGKVIGQFAQRLSEELTAPRAVATAPEALATPDATPPAPPPTPQTEALDLGQMVGTPAVRSIAIGAFALTLLLVIVRKLRS